MKFVQIAFLALIVGCGNSQAPRNSVAEEPTEEFESFYTRFYSDTSFQNSRIILPLEGTIRSWEGDGIIEDTWAKQKISITDKGVYMNQYQNLKVEIKKVNSSYIERYWLENSGFFIEREFVIREGKWCLSRYDISNI